MEENKAVIDVTPEVVIDTNLEATASEPKYIQMVVDKGNRKYIFLIPDNSPIGETFDAAFQILERINELGKEALAKAVDTKTVEAAPTE